MSVTAAMLVHIRPLLAGGRGHYILIAVTISNCSHDTYRSKVLPKYFQSTSKVLQSTSKVLHHFQSTSDIFEVTWKYDKRTYVIIAKIKQVACFAECFHVSVYRTLLISLIGFFYCFSHLGQ